MAAQLETPRSEEDLFYARAADVEPYRPFLQGDCFTGVTIPGVTVEHDHCLIISHPCSMRAGAVVNEVVQAVPIVAYQEVPFRKWADSHLRCMPLPNLLLDGHPRAALFEQTGMVRSRDLTPDMRRSVLTERGVFILQQRYVFFLTRAILDLSRIQDASEPVMTEVELLEDWNSTLVKARVSRGEDLLEAIAAEAAEFDAFIRAPREADGSLQEQLKERVKRGDVRKILRQEIASRHSPA